MQSINITDIRKIDLNLALVFYVIFEKRSVSAAAQELYVTQPAISAALGRLRTLYGDALFVREGRGLRPTPYAETLMLTLRPALAQLQAGLLPRKPFEPATSTQTFRVGFADGLEMGLISSIGQKVRRLAPSMRLSVRGTDFHNVEGQIERDELDLAIGVFDQLPKTVFRKPLHRLNFQLLFDPAHIQVRRTIALDKFIELEHVLVSYRGDFRGLFEVRNEKRGLKRNIVMTVSRFSSVPYLIRGSAMVCTMPDYLAFRFADTFGLACIPAPFVEDSFEIEMIWPVYLDHEPDHAWLREQFVQCVKADELTGRRASPSKS